MNAFPYLIRPNVVLGVIFSGAALILVSGCDTREADTRATAPATAPVATSVGTEIDDGVVTAKVKSALLADPDIKSFDLKVETRKGEVMLSGFVSNQAQVDRAILVARGVEGVKAVANKMDLKEGAATVGNTVDDGIITAKVKSALLADPDIKSLDIAVVTSKGEAQLSGFVDNQTQIDRAIEVARAVDGVKSVASQMSVKK
jgi:hyperosmotically inducible protein